MKIIELSDAVSMFKNSGQTLTLPVVREGKIADSGISLLFFDDNHEKLLLSCKADGLETSLLLEKETRLPFGENREEIKIAGFDFLFQSCEGADFTWFFVDNLNDDDYNVKYEARNKFLDSYRETPLRDFLSAQNLFSRLILYFPKEGKQENVDGIAVLEIGNELTTNSGLIYYYNFRIIEQNFIETL